jgi:hypothetical protein
VIEEDVEAIAEVAGDVGPEALVVALDRVILEMNLKIRQDYAHQGKTSCKEEVILRTQEFSLVVSHYR